MPILVGRHSSKQQVWQQEQEAERSLTAVNMKPKKSTGSGMRLQTFSAYPQ